MNTNTSAGALLREVARLHTQLQRTCVAYCGGTTTTQCMVLTELGHSGPVTLTELTLRLGFDKSWTSRAVEHLVQEGLVEKEASVEDRRTVRIALSAAGQARLEEVRHTLNALADQTFERIPAEQHEQVRAALEALRHALLALTAEASDSGAADGGVMCRRD